MKTRREITQEANERKRKRRRDKTAHFFKETMLVILKLALLAAIVYGASRLVVVTNGHFHLITATTLDLRNSEVRSFEGLERYKNLKAVDMRGNDLTLEEYEALKTERPDLYIRWEVPINGTRIDCKAESLVFDSIPEDAENLALFDNLKSIVIGYPENKEELLAFAAQYPEGLVSWSHVFLDGQWLDTKTDTFVFETIPENTENLELFDNIRSITIVHPEDTDELLAFASQYPDGVVGWSFVDIDGQWYETITDNFVFETIPADAEQLSLFDSVSSITIVHPDDRDGLLAFAAKYPEGVVSWSYVSIGGQWLERTTDTFVFETLPDDIENLSLFDSVSSITVEHPDDRDEILDFASQYPEGTVKWQVEVGGEWYSPDTAEFTLDGASAAFEQLLDAAAYFPNLSKITVTGDTLSPSRQSELVDSYPDISFIWNIRLGEDIFNSDTEHLSFTEGTGPSLEDLEAALRFLPKLKSVDFDGSSVSGFDRCAFRAAHPEYECSWTVSFMGKTYDLSVTELNLDGIQFENTDEIYEAISMWPDMQYVAIDNTGLSDDEIGVLVDAFPNVKFVWTIYFGNYYLRTDATFFIPSAWKNGSRLFDRDIKPIRYCTDIIGLDLGHTCVESLEFVKYMPHLKYLIIVDSSVYDIAPLAYCKELEYLEAYVLGIRDFSPLLECPSLQHLNIGYTRSTAADAFEVLSQMTQLKRLWYCCCPFSYEQIEAMHEALPDCEMYMPSMGQSTGSTWRYDQSYYDMRDLFGMYYMPGGTAGTDADGNQVIIDDWGTRIVLYDWDLTQRWFEMEQYKYLNWHIVGINC